MFSSSETTMLHRHVSTGGQTDLFQVNNTTNKRVTCKDFPSGVYQSLHTLTLFLWCHCSQKEVSTEEYGPTMADLEKQIAAHNILHKEIDAYSSQLCISSAGSKVNIHSSIFKWKYILMSLWVSSLQQNTQRVDTHHSSWLKLLMPSLILMSSL